MELSLLQPSNRVPSELRSSRLDLKGLVAKRLSFQTLGPYPWSLLPLRPSLTRLSIRLANDS